MLSFDVPQCGHFNALNTKPPPPELEVLKRAGLVMAMTAWETYVEDRVLEAAAERLRRVSDAAISKFIETRLNEDVRRLHNPTSERTIQLFRDYAGVDFTDKWFWNNADQHVVRNRLDEYIKPRGE